MCELSAYAIVIVVIIIIVVIIVVIVEVIIVISYLCMCELFALLYMLVCIHPPCDASTVTRRASLLYIYVAIHVYHMNHRRHHHRRRHHHHHCRHMSTCSIFWRRRL